MRSTRQLEETLRGRLLWHRWASSHSMDYTVVCGLALVSPLPTGGLVSLMDNEWGTYDFETVSEPGSPCPECWEDVL